MAAPYDALRIQHTTLLGLYASNVEAVLTLQRIMKTDMLLEPHQAPSVSRQAETELNELADDIATIFRMLKRNSFSIHSTVDSLRNLVAWRLTTLPRSIHDAPQFVRCLPTTDPLGRPIVIIRLSVLTNTAENCQGMILECMELLRIHLQQLNAKHGRNGLDEGPIMQYTAILDFVGISMMDLRRLEIVSWCVHEVIPRFPSILSAVFVLNHTWAHYSIWQLSKRVLPSSAFSRIFFPSQQELLAYFSPASLPSDFGGRLSSLSELDDPLCAYVAPPTLDQSFIELNLSDADEVRPNHALSSIAMPSMSPTSVWNPFFGYPVSYRFPTPILTHGRRRKRDLVRTLLRLLWARWSKHAVLLLALLIASVLPRLSRKIGFNRDRSGYARA